MKPTHPTLWQSAKDAARALGPETGNSPSGEWSPRKLILARLEYARRGGRWREYPEPQAR